MALPDLGKSGDLDEFISRGETTGYKFGEYRNNDTFPTQLDFQSCKILKIVRVAFFESWLMEEKIQERICVFSSINQPGVVMKIQVCKQGAFKLVYFELPTFGVDPVAVAAKIDAMAESWNGPETVLFRGQGPVWLYGMLVHSAHATPNTATFEPRKDGYVVVHQHGGEQRPGDVIPSSVVGMTIENGKIVGGEDATPRRHLVVSVGGPAHSGKSVLLAELYRQLLDRMPGEVFLQRGCPDGEGMWSAESDPSMVKAIRKKGQFGEQFTGWVTDAIRGLQRGFAITLVDLGGKRLPPNDDILRGSTHCIVLSSQEAETKAWVEYGQSYGCEVLAVIDSRLVTNESGELDSLARSSLDTAATPVTGKLVNLDREAPADPYREAVKMLAERLIVEAGQ